MPTTHKAREALHDATHRIPGVPEHREQSPGHQGASLQNRGNAPTADHREHRPVRRHEHRPPRVLVAWQNRIARLVGQEAR